jgi:hypothetical protein
MVADRTMVGLGFLQICRLMIYHVMTAVTNIIQLVLCKDSPGPTQGDATYWHAQRLTLCVLEALLDAPGLERPF